MNIFQWLNHLFAGWKGGPKPISAPSPSPSSPNSTSATSPKSSPPPIAVSTAKPSGANRMALLPVLAAREVGKKETKGSNLGPEVRKYQSATNLDPGAWPWCSAFCAWALQQWLADPENRAWLALKKTSSERWRPKTALAYGWIEWAKARPATVEILPDTAEPRAGDIVIYDFSHIGIVQRNVDKEFFSAVEGNTNGAGSREGDGVYVKMRRRSLARVFLRIKPSGA